MRRCVQKPLPLRSALRMFAVLSFALVTAIWPVVMMATRTARASRSTFGTEFFGS